MAANRVPDRAVRAIYTVWRFPGDDRAICGEYPRRGAVYPTGVGDIGGRTAQCGVTCVGGGLIEDDLRATSILRVYNYNDDYMHPLTYARRHSFLKVYNYNDDDDDDDYMQAKIKASNGESLSA